MPEEIINLKFSDPYLLVDPNRKYIPLEGMYSEDVYDCKTQVEHKAFNLNLNILSPDADALIELGDPLIAVINSDRNGLISESDSIYELTGNIIMDLNDGV